MNVGASVTAVKSSRVLLYDQVIPAVIVIEDGKIHKIIPPGDSSADDDSKVKVSNVLYECVIIEMNVVLSLL